MTVFDPAPILRALVTHDVTFLVIGHIAGILQGSPSVTRDLDITPLRDIANAEQLVAALEALDATTHLVFGAEVDDQPPDERQFLGWQPLSYLTRHGRLDIVPFPAATGGYEDLIDRAVTLEVAGVQVKVASLDDVIASKRALARPKDRAQLPALEATRAVLRRRGELP